VEGGKSKRRKVIPAAMAAAATARATKGEPLNDYEREREVRSTFPNPPAVEMRYRLRLEPRVRLLLSPISSDC
jgi:hypothetical protein